MMLELLRIKIKELSSVLDVLDGFLGGLEFTEGAGDQFAHLFTSAEDGDGLLVLIAVDLDLVNQLLVDQFVFVD